MRFQDFGLAVMSLLLVASISFGDDVTEMGRLVGAGQQLEKEQRFVEAIDAYERAGAIAAKVYGPTHKYVATMAAMSGALYRQTGKYAEAEKRLEQALSLYEQGGDPHLIAEALNNLAAAKYEIGKYDEALDLHQRSVKRMETNLGPNSPSTATAWGNLAGVYERLGQLSQAESLYLKSTAVLERHRDTHLKVLADTLANLANVYLAQGEMSRAVPLIQRAVLLKEGSYGPDHFEVARTLNNLGVLYSTMGQYDKAEQTMQRVVSILEKALGPNHADVARGLTNLAANERRTKKYELAEAHYKRALQIREAALGPDHLDVATSLEHLSSLYQAVSRYPESVAAAERSLKIRREKLGDGQIPVAYSLSSLAMTRLLEGKSKEAEELFNQSLKIRQEKLPPTDPIIAETQASLAWINAATGRQEQALDLFDKSRRGVRIYIAQVLSVLSEPEQIAFLKNIDQQRYYLALSVAYAHQNQRARDVSVTWILNSKGMAQEILGQRALIARDSSNPALALISRSLVAIRKQLATLSLVAAPTGEASRRRQMDELTEREATIARQMALVAGRPVLRSDFVELETVRKNIPDDARLIELARFGTSDFTDPKLEKMPERYGAWIIPPVGNGEVLFVDLGPAEPIDQAVEAARAKLTKSIDDLRESGEPEAEQQLKVALQPLSKLVLEPLLKPLGDCQKVYLSPDAGLWIVPWSALPLADGKYAVEKLDIRYLISGRDLIPSDGQTVSSSRPILIADPNYDLTPKEVQEATAELFKRPVGPGMVQGTPEGTNTLGQAPRLPGTKREAQAIQPKIERIANTEAYLYSDKWALEAVFKSLQQPQILVLSTHGFFREAPPAKLGDTTDTSNPLLRCGLLLAGCNKPSNSVIDGVEDGILTGVEIVGTDLRGTDLVVLSACETGLGEVRNGEGVAGLRQAFQLAGAKSVVATLWQIPDRETAQLMTEFFNQLASGVDRSASLREAQLKIIAARRERNEAAHPFFWAAFTITGR